MAVLIFWHRILCTRPTVHVTFQHGIQQRHTLASETFPLDHMQYFFVSKWRVTTGAGAPWCHILSRSPITYRHQQIRYPHRPRTSHSFGLRSSTAQPESRQMDIALVPPAQWMTSINQKFAPRLTQIILSPRTRSLHLGASR